ncbi:hypothetical protein [Paractinoplanes lichenicola]|uniref:Sporulation protein YjcZ n=1 Tax=Paractinoplanes lichenicola TaxID=2802976 RepID=A0ABS1W360_9ACTN|nr:hypothetical protein [Actinoplanes lichenicola]MBL7261176.1 hypothetical protein [Actinoplanes lichenicola]
MRGDPEHYSTWRREGSPSPLDNVGGCGGCLWILLAIFAIFTVISFCAGGGIGGR